MSLSLQFFSQKITRLSRLIAPSLKLLAKFPFTQLRHLFMTTQDKTEHLEHLSIYLVLVLDGDGGHAVVDGVDDLAPHAGRGWARDRY